MTVAKVEKASNRGYIPRVLILETVDEYYAVLNGMYRLADDDVCLQREAAKEIEQALRGVYPESHEREG